MNRRIVEQKEAMYKRRQAIVEHPFGTIKRQWGFSYITTKKYKQRASADVGLMFTAYNLRRIFNILGQKTLIEYLERIAFNILRINCYIRFNSSRFKTSNFQNQLGRLFFKDAINMLIFNPILIKTEAF